MPGTEDTHREKTFAALEDHLVSWVWKLQGPFRGTASDDVY